jgi:hypothetical protein
MPTITFEIPDKVYEEKQKEIEKVISEADEAFGRIDSSIYCSKESDADADMDWAEGWIVDMEGDFDIRVDEHVVKDVAILKDITDRIWKVFYYENGYGHLSGAFVNVAHLLVLDVAGTLHVHAYVEHGVNDCDESGTTYHETVDFKMQKDKEGKLVICKGKMEREIDD